jgi:hypothetical protein
MAQTRLRSVDLELAAVLADMPPEEVRCRAGNHYWARDSVLPGQPWPDVVRAWPWRYGRYRIEDPCLKCSMAWRVTLTGVDGELDAFARTHIVYDPDWVRVPQGLDRRKRTIRREGYRRGAKKNKTSLKDALARTVEREQAPQSLHPRFQSASGS